MLVNLDQVLGKAKAEKYAVGLFVVIMVWVVAGMYCCNYLAHLFYRR